jgi:hypothetical protein
VEQMRRVRWKCGDGEVEWIGLLKRIEDHTSVDEEKQKRQGAKSPETKIPINHRRPQEGGNDGFYRFNNQRIQIPPLVLVAVVNCRVCWCVDH